MPFCDRTSGLINGIRNKSRCTFEADGSLEALQLLDTELERFYDLFLGRNFLSLGLNGLGLSSNQFMLVYNLR